ncbi:shikimate dehydrogenase [Amnibacterium sp.]|uniref:shikimate dehydrogenase family protein n=1 Tax=Amnibacterium sp. TaxID=1872496 RepID=UPI002608051B|nr:shikimate dehydrogenase [Amnibacterium sp.]MCU1473706.1 shikimate dehydrogenase [Amnibacterium sp.]
MAPRRLAVLGAPIAHSKSPLLHAAAYRVLGLDWEYGRAEVDEAGLEAFLAGLGPEWRGLSLTMPLKRAVLRLVPGGDQTVARLGLANTVLLDGRPALFNTDVPAIVAVLGEIDPERPSFVLGGGATAASALEALRLLGADRRIVVARDPRRARRALGDLATEYRPLEPDALIGVLPGGVVVSTLPGGVDAASVVPHRLDGERLLDVAYDPWPSPLGRDWSGAGGGLLHGLDMLLEQALLQVRVFTAGDPDVHLPDEERVRAAMAAAVGRDMEDS